MRAASSCTTALALGNRASRFLARSRAMTFSRPVGTLGLTSLGRGVDADLRDATGRQRAVREHLGQRGIVDELRDDVRDALVVARVERAHDVGVVQRRRAVSCVYEQLTDRGVLVELLLEHLEDD